MWTVIGILALVAAIAVGAILIYRNNQKPAEAVITAVQKDAAAVSTTVSEAEAAAKKA